MTITSFLSTKWALSTSLVSGHHFLRNYHQSFYLICQRWSPGSPLAVGRGKDLKVNGKMPTLSSQCVNKIKASVEQDVVERQSYCLYHSELLEVIGLMGLDVDMKKMEKKMPQVEIGISIMVTLNIPVSVLVVALHLLDAAKVIMDGDQGRSVD